MRVTRLVGAFSAGWILNRLTALNQLQGGMIWGLGSALLEQSVTDKRTGRYVNDNLSEYLVATAADTPPHVEAILLDDNGDRDPAQLMGLGELGIIGVAAAIANALAHATGRRFRNLPIRCESIL
jgi:xanthine dehydrogenase YagR molybdenum-binding subunit